MILKYCYSRQHVMNLTLGTREHAPKALIVRKNDFYVFLIYLVEAGGGNRGMQRKG